MTMIKPKTCVATMITPQCEGQSGSTFPLSNLCEIMIVRIVIRYVVIAWSASEIALNGWVYDHNMCGLGLPHIIGLVCLAPSLWFESFTS